MDDIDFINLFLASFQTSHFPNSRIVREKQRKLFVLTCYQINIFELHHAGIKQSSKFV